jgi:hypothetical protein
MLATGHELVLHLTERTFAACGYWLLYSFLSSCSVFSAKTPIFYAMVILRRDESPFFWVIR